MNKGKEKLIEIQKELQANKPKTKPYVWSPSLQRERQEALNTEYRTMWWQSILQERPTSEIYFKDEYNE